MILFIGFSINRYIDKKNFLIILIDTNKKLFNTTGHKNFAKIHHKMPKPPSLCIVQLLLLHLDKIGLESVLNNHLPKLGTKINKLLSLYSAIQHIRVKNNAIFIGVQTLKSIKNIEPGFLGCIRSGFSVLQLFLIQTVFFLVVKIYIFPPKMHCKLLLMQSYGLFIFILQKSASTKQDDTGMHPGEIKQD